MNESLDTQLLGYVIADGLEAMVGRTTADPDDFKDWLENQILPGRAAPNVGRIDAFGSHPVATFIAAKLRPGIAERLTIRLQREAIVVAPGRAWPETWARPHETSVHVTMPGWLCAFVCELDKATVRQVDAGLALEVLEKVLAPPAPTE